MSELEDWINRTEKFIRQQRDLCGDFSVSDIDSSIMEAPDEFPADPSLSDTTVLGSIKSEPTLKTVFTLSELYTICENSKELKTDLDNTNLVFGTGNPEADLMIIGEAPGETEDKLGEPFVGAAGKLLDKIMEAIHFSREDVYIANILKHRPPNNRDPKAEERERSLPYLMKQIEIVDPKLILCVGRVAATTLLEREDSLKNMRQKFHEFHGRELMVTYHPAALLRNPGWKRPAWEDVQMLRKRYDELEGKP